VQPPSAHAPGASWHGGGERHGPHPPLEDALLPDAALLLEVAPEEAALLELEVLAVCEAPPVPPVICTTLPVLPGAPPMPPPPPDPTSRSWMPTISEHAPLVTVPRAVSTATRATSRELRFTETFLRGRDRPV